MVGKLEFSWFEFPNHAKNREHWGFLINWPRGGTERAENSGPWKTVSKHSNGSPCVSTVQAEGEAEEHRSDGGEDRNES